MPVKIKLNPVFQPFSGNQEIVEVKGSTIKECLDELVALFPALRNVIFDAEGNLSALVLLNDETILPSDFCRPVKSHNKLALLPLIYGG
jgi:molybdopterin converting factor small subunit